jgi:WD40 repeat protein
MPRMSVLRAVLGSWLVAGCQGGGGTMVDPPPDAAPGRLPPLSCQDAVIDEDPRGAGGVPDLCGFGEASCFVPKVAMDGDSYLAISVDWAADDHVLVGAVDEVRLLRVDPVADTITERAMNTDQLGRITVAWSPDGQFALGVGDVDVRLYQITREPPALTTIGAAVTHTGAILGVAWAPDGKSAVTTGKDSTARLMTVDTATGALAEIARFTAPGNKRLFTVSYAPDGQHVLVGGEEGHARLLAVDVAGAQLTEVAAIAHDVQVCPVAWGPSGDALVGTWVPCHSSIERVSFDASFATMTAEAPFAHHESGLRALAWGPDGSYALSGGHDDTVRFLGRHAGTMRVVDVLPQTTMGVHALTWSPSGEYFLHVSSQHDRLQLVDARACIACARELEAGAAP